MNKKVYEQPGWIGVDLDGTLAHYDGWKGIDHIGPPIHRMVEYVKDLLAKGVEVRILTARAGPQRGGAQDIVHAIQAIRVWCKKHLGEELRVTAEKDMAMIWLYDDRATRVMTNEGVFFDPGHIYPRADARVGGSSWAPAPRHLADPDPANQI